MPAEAPTVKLILEQCKSGTANVRIHFPTTTVTTPGHKLTKKDSKPSPTLSISSSIAKSAETKYVAIELDLDAPFPSFAFMSPILHGIQTDLTADGPADAEGFIKLTASVKPAVSYAPPGPPPISSPHRYVFFIFEQPEGLTAEKVKTTMKFGDEVGIPPRVRFDQAACEQKLGLGAVLGGNYFVV